jgi:DNA-directed RNA polymerase subunit RPC12/RpoP
MQLVNVLALPDDIYLLVKCICGALIKHKRTIFRITCPDCGYTVTVDHLKDLKHL